MRQHSDHGGHHLRSRDLQLPSDMEMHMVVRIFQALSDLTRAKVIFALTQGEQSVNEIAAIVGASPSSVSHHLRRLMAPALNRSAKSIVLHSIKLGHSPSASRK